MQLIPYLNFNGRCREAFDFYRDVFKGEIEGIVTYGDSQIAEICGDMPPETRDQVAHICLKVGDLRLMGSDGPPSEGKPGQGTIVNISVDRVEEAERIWAALSDGGDVAMALDETFWAQRFGMAVDRFGTSWMVNCPKPDYRPGSASS